MNPYMFYNVRSVVADYTAELYAQAENDRLVREAVEGRKKGGNKEAGQLEVLQAVKQGQLSIEEGLLRLNRLEKA